MAEDKKSFLLYADLIHTVRKMPKDKAGELLLHILEYVNDTNPQTDDILINIAFEPIKQQMKRDLSRWEDVKFKRSEAGKASAEARRLQKEAEQKLTKSTSVNKAQQEPTNPTVNDTVNVTVINKEIKVEPVQDFSHLELEILSIFGFNDMPQYIDKRRSVHEFIKFHSKDGKLDAFMEQSRAYNEHLKIGTNIKYRFKLENFLGKQEERYKNGKWLSENWVEKVNSVKISNAPRYTPGGSRN